MNCQSGRPIRFLFFIFNSLIIRKSQKHDTMFHPSIHLPLVLTFPNSLNKTPVTQKHNNYDSSLQKKIIYPYLLVSEPYPVHSPQNSLLAGRG